MQAITYSTYGTAEVLKLTERPTPERSRGRVLIRVAAAGVNPIDYRIRQGQMRWLLPGGFPRTPGYDVAGRVVEADPGSGFAGGDRVLAFLDNVRGGGYAEFAVASNDAVVPIPERVDFPAAAGLPLAGSTVLQAFRGVVEAPEGGSVLVHGASGGVGSLAVQIAKAYGAEVTGVASGKRHEFVKDLGADAFIDYETTDFTRTGNRWDLVFDVAGNLVYGDARRAVAEGGTFVSTEPSARGLLMQVATSCFRRKARVVLARPQRSLLEELVRLLESGQVRVPIDQVFPLAEAGEAHQRIEHGGVRGKLVLDVAGEAGG